MYDKQLLRDILEDMIEAVLKVQKRCSRFESSSAFLENEESQIVLDSICMQLIAIGEAVKKIDKITDKMLLSQYSEIPWRSIAGIRDVLSHHYFDLNAETVFGICEENIEPLLQVLRRIYEKINLLS